MSSFVAHFINVGCGNMTLLLFPNGATWLYDCNVTDDNEDDVLGYLSKAMGNRTTINVFICSHRDADHMRGLRRVHDIYPVKEIRDPGVVGTTTNSSEYKDYMALRRDVINGTISAYKYLQVGQATVRYMHSADDVHTDANDQSIVMKIEYEGNALLLAGDTSFSPWKNSILNYYPDDRLKADILLGSHHGSLTFFDDPGDEEHYYTAHIKRIAPAMTILSVGDNAWDFPDDKAVELYKLYSTGSNKGYKVRRTDVSGNMKLVFSSDGWTLYKNQ